MDIDSFRVMMSNVAAALRPLLPRRAAEIAARGRALPALASVGVDDARLRQCLRRPLPPLRRSVHVEAKIESLGIELPAAPLPKANYNIVCLPPGEDVMYVSGHLPIKPDGELIAGTLGPDAGGMTVEEGYAAARHCGLNIISTLKAQLGDLDRVEQVVKVFGIVNSHADFKHQHLVVDGCSDVIMEVFDKPVGYHARSAIGTNTLPLNASVEVEAIVKIKRE